MIFPHLKSLARWLGAGVSLKKEDSEVRSSFVLCKCSSTNAPIYESSGKASSGLELG
jgi:hypothetical protein